MTNSGKNHVSVFNDIDHQERLAASRTGVFEIGQQLSERVVLNEYCAIRADHPVKMEKETDSALSHSQPILIPNGGAADV